MRALAVAAATGMLLVGCADEEPQGPPELAFGDYATVRVEGAQGRQPVSATVRLVERGSVNALVMGGLSTVDLQGKVPWYVRVAYVNTAGHAFNAPPQQQFRPRQHDGAYAVRLAIVSPQPFAPCVDPVPAAAFSAPGGTSEACIVVLAAPDATLTSVEWTFRDRTTEAVWRPA